MPPAPHRDPRAGGVDSEGSVGAVILAGGRASRWGGVVKPLATIDGTTMLDLALGAVPVGAGIVVVGPPQLPVPAGVQLVREDPPFGGPVAALAAGAAALPADTDWVLVLAADQPTVGTSVRILLAADRAQDGVIGLDGTDRRQPLAALYRSSSLRESLYSNGSAPRRLMDVVAALVLREVFLGDQLDVDTADDAHRAGVERPMIRAFTELDRHPPGL